MLGWIFSIALLIVYAREPSMAARPELLFAAGLFALAGSIGSGLNTIGNKLKGSVEEDDEDSESEEEKE